MNLTKKLIGSMALAVATLAGVGAHAAGGELDSGAARAQVPASLVVRVDARTGRSEVFASNADRVSNDAQAVEANANLGQRLDIVNGSELDATTSTGAWCRWYNPYYSNYNYGYYYSYAWYGYQTYYYPCYSYYGSGYYYYYYRY